MARAATTKTAFALAGLGGSVFWFTVPAIVVEGAATVRPLAGMRVAVMSPNRLLAQGLSAQIREAGGDATDLLISSSALGHALAEKFDTSDIVLMRGHGSTVVGGSIQQAVYRAVYAELNARYQLEAMKVGEVTYLTEGESRAAVQNVEAQVHRPWDLWVEQAKARRGRG